MTPLETITQAVDMLERTHTGESYSRAYIAERMLTAVCLLRIVVNQLEQHNVTPNSQLVERVAAQYFPEVALYLDPNRKVHRNMCIAAINEYIRQTLELEAHHD